jgi:hypothetical protein
MIELLDRQEIFKLNKTFASFIVDIQDTTYNPTLDHNKNEPGEMYVDDNELPRFVSQEECDKWNEEAFEEYQKRRDYLETISIKEKHRGGIIYNFQKDRIDKYVENLAESISALSNKLQWKSVLFLLDYPTPWLHQDNDYEPVKNSLNFITGLGVDKHFIGGFKADGNELTELTRNLFWIIRCNASLPICYFSGVNTDFIGNICEYGSIHFHFYSDKASSEIKKAAADIGMIEVEDGRCIEDLSEMGTIKGQEIVK